MNTKNTPKAKNLPEQIPADQLARSVACRLNDQAERIRGLAGMALNDGDFAYSFDFESIARELNALCDQIMRHTRE